VFQYLRSDNYLKGGNPKRNPADRALKESECDDSDNRSIDEAYAVTDGWTVKDGGHMCGLQEHEQILLYISSQKKHFD